MSHSVMPSPDECCTGPLSVPKGSRTRRFKMTIIRALLLLCLAATPVLAQAPERTVADAVVRQGKLSFDGRATAGNFTGTTTTLTGKLQGGLLSQVRGWVEAPVSTLATGNQRRDRDLNKSMESDKYPTIRFELTNVTGGNAGGDSLDVVLH